MSLELSWKKRAQQTARKINLGWWLQTLATPLLVASLSTAGIILILRRELESYSYQEFAIASAVIFTILGIICFMIARRRFETSDESLVRIEAKMKLQNALTAADQGIAQWPELPSSINDGVQWHWKRLLPPLLGSLLILICGFLIPIQAKADAASDQQPHAWEKLESSLEVLEDQEIVQEEYLDEIREKLEELRDQSPEEWFSHSSLEATDNLLKNHASEQEQLKNSMQRFEQTLDALQNPPVNMSAQQRQQLMNQLDQALQKMEQGAMKPNKELLDQLKNLDPSQLKQLSQEQLDQLRENMRRKSQQLSQGNSYKPGEGEGSEGDGDGEGSEGDGDKPGKGGISRGPGHAPNPLGEVRPDTGAGDHEGLQSTDHSNSLPGDLLETSDSEHNVDKSTRAPREGGSTEGSGKGGNHVWKNSMLPNEKKALKKFFE